MKVTIDIRLPDLPTGSQRKQQWELHAKDAWGEFDGLKFELARTVRLGRASNRHKWVVVEDAESQYEPNARPWQIRQYCQMKEKPVVPQSVVDELIRRITESIEVSA